MQVLSLPPAVLYTLVGKPLLLFSLNTNKSWVGLLPEFDDDCSCHPLSLTSQTHAQTPSSMRGLFLGNKNFLEISETVSPSTGPRCCRYCWHWNGCLGQEKQDKKSDNAEGCGAQKRSTWWDKLEAQKQLGQCQVTTGTLEENVLRRHVQNTSVIKGAPLAQCNPKGSNSLSSKGFPKSPVNWRLKHLFSTSPDHIKFRQLPFTQVAQMFHSTDQKVSISWWGKQAPAQFQGPWLTSFQIKMGSSKCHPCTRFIKEF